MAGKHFYGHRDELRPEGGSGRFELLWFRSFRYLAIEIRTADEALTIASIDLTATAFPLGEASELTANGPEAHDLTRLLEISDRTIRLCAQEVFFDCPHYEQCQFPGDSRLQALYHYARFGDDRLARKAIDDFAGSARFDGLVPCRWPSEKIQHIPTYALHTVGMLDDFRIWRGDAGFIRGYLPMARAVVAWFQRRLRPDGLLGRIPFAPFVDWSPGFHQGNALQDADGGSSHLCLLLAEGLRCLAALEDFAGLPELAPRWRADREALLAAVRRHCWCPQRELLAETPAKTAFSRHTQYLAVIEELVPRAIAADHLRRTEAGDLIPVGTFYFQHYRLTAARLAGVSGALVAALPRWRNCLAGTGLNTWPETDNATPRSDCHAWSSAWVLSLIHGSLGLSPEPTVAGLGRLRLRPDLTGLDQIAGILPTPRGPVVLNVERQGKHLAIELDTPVPVILADDRTLAPGRYRLVV